LEFGVKASSLIVISQSDRETTELGSLFGSIWKLTGFAVMQ
jgi:hypothetical protein